MPACENCIYDFRSEPGETEKLAQPLSAAAGCRCQLRDALFRRGEHLSPYGQSFSKQRDDSFVPLDLGPISDDQLHLLTLTYPTDGRGEHNGTIGVDLTSQKFAKADR